MLIKLGPGTALTLPSQSTSLSLRDVNEAEDKELDSPLFLGPAQKGPNGVFNTPFEFISRIFKVNGVESFRLKVAMVIWLALNSAHLDNPFTVEIIDAPDCGAAKLLDIAKKATCPEFIQNFAKLDLKTLFKNRADLKGRTIVADNSSGFEKVASDLNRLLATQRLTDSGRYADVGQEIEVSGPIGCVMVTKEPPFILSDFSFLKLYLYSDPKISFGSLSEKDQALYDVYCGIIKMSLGRIKPRLIGNPFEGLLAFCFDARTPERERQKIITFGRMIRLIHLINNPPAVYASEVLSKMWGVPQDSIKQGSENPSQAPIPETGCNKLDYYIFWSLMNDLLPKNDPYLSPREQNLIRIIDDFKRERYPGETGEIWLSAERIFEKVKEDGREPIGTIKTLDHELKKMSEKGVIRERKALRAKHYEYLVDTTKPFLVPIVLPDPHLVKDGNFDQSPIKILNPITGRVDEI